MQEITNFFNNYKELIQSVGGVFTIIGVLGALLFNAYSLRRNTKVLQINNLFQITQFHRNIWSLTLEHPSLSRVLDKDIDNSKLIVTPEESLFISFLIMHLNLGFQASKVHAITAIEGTEKDIEIFFSLPIPRKVWVDIKKLQNKDFVTYVEKHMHPLPKTSITKKPRKKIN